MLVALERQAALHPAMQPQDAIKACYQAAFGAEHLLTDAARARAYLHEELSACAGEESALTEPLSDTLCRLNLRAWKARGWPEDWLWTLFARSNAPEAQGEARMREALAQAGALCRAGRLPFTEAEWQTALTEYLQGGLRPVHHSARYRAAERPAYRLLSLRQARLLPLLARTPEKGVVALDGRAASGKTTLAEDFAAVTGAGVVHMDDFFLPAELRTPERLRTPGGNVHYERFAAEVLPHLRADADFTYRRFDCARMALRGERRVRGSALYLVEGAYSCHPALGGYMDVRAFSDIEKDEQARRLLSREGEKGYKRFQERWLPLEEAYFQACGVYGRTDVVL